MHHAGVKSSIDSSLLLQPCHNGPGQVRLSGARQGVARQAGFVFHAVDRRAAPRPGCAGPWPPCSAQSPHRVMNGVVGAVLSSLQKLLHPAKPRSNLHQLSGAHPPQPRPPGPGSATAPPVRGSCGPNKGPGHTLMLWTFFGRLATPILGLTQIYVDDLCLQL